MRILTLMLAVMLTACAAEDPAGEATADASATSRDAASGESMIAGGGAIMPDDLDRLDPSQYSQDLAGFIPVEIGMDQFAAKDEFLVYYNADTGPQTRVSMTEKTIDGATVFVIRRSGLQDDSIGTEESYALFDGGVLAAYGTRLKCARSIDPEAWTTEVCP